MQRCRARLRAACSDKAGWGLKGGRGKWTRKSGRPRWENRPIFLGEGMSSIHGWQLRRVYILQENLHRGGGATVSEIGGRRSDGTGYPGGLKSWRLQLHEHQFLGRGTWSMWLVKRHDARGKGARQR